MPPWKGESRAMFTSRRARREDFKIIASFPQSQDEQFYMFPRGTFPLDPVHLEEVAKERLHPTVILSGEEIAGYCNLYDVEADSRCWLGNVIINPDYRGRGAGKFLLDTMLTTVRDELHLPELHLICHNPNTAALKFYHKNGFIPYGLKEMVDYKEQPIIGILMKKYCEPC